MKFSLRRCVMASLHRFCHSAIQRFDSVVFLPALIFCGLIFPLTTGAQFSKTDDNSTRSVSGQFIVVGPAQRSQLAGMPRVATDTNLVRLEPALLAVSAERIKDNLYRRLEINPDVPWRGQIYLAVHPARALNENVTILTRFSAQVCSYTVELPDALSPRRLTQAMTGVILLEYANRDAQSHSAEIPAWLTDGLAEEMLASGLPENILSAPVKTLNGVPFAQINTVKRGIDSQVEARHALEKNPPLTFDELSWPTAAQLAGDDGGAYRASAQIFVDALLDLKDGPQYLRAFLESLPQDYNWETAFLLAFQQEFYRPLDLEKWWALQLVNLAAHDRGPGWTPALSRARLDAILSVPVEIRSASNSLPVRAEISLQTVIRSLDPAQQSEILEVKLRDLRLAQFRMAPQLAGLTDGYARALAGYLGEALKVTAAPLRSNHTASPKKANVVKTLKTLDVLDAERRNIEATIKPDAQPGIAPVRF